MNASRTLIFFLTLAWSASRAASPFAVDGVVRDEKTGKPMEGVFIIAQWMNNGSDGVGARTTCPNLAIARSDAQGRYHIPAWLPGAAPSVDRYVTPYKNGYEDASASRSMPVEEYERYVRALVMRPFTGTGDERLLEYSFLAQLASCGHDQLETYGKLHAVYRAMHEEATTLKVSPERQRSLDEAREHLEWFEGELAQLQRDKGRGK